MDLSKIIQKLEGNKYYTYDELKNDIELMCENAMLYNDEDTIYYKKAEEILDAAAKWMTCNEDWCKGGKRITRSKEQANSKMHDPIEPMNSKKAKEGIQDNSRPRQESFLEFPHHYI